MPSATTCNSKNGGKGCDRPVLAKGLCQSHYLEDLRGRDPHGPIRGYGQGLKELTLRLSQDTLDRYKKEAERLHVSEYILRRTVIETWLDDPKFRKRRLSEVDLWDAKKIESTVRLSAKRYADLVKKAKRKRVRGPHPLGRLILQTWLDMPAKNRPLNEVIPSDVFAAGPAEEEA